MSNTDRWWDAECPNDAGHETEVEEDDEYVVLRCIECDEVVNSKSRIPKGANGPETYQWKAMKARGP